MSLDVTLLLHRQIFQSILLFQDYRRSVSVPKHGSRVSRNLAAIGTDIPAEAAVPPSSAETSVDSGATNPTVSTPAPKSNRPRPASDGFVRDVGTFVSVGQEVKVRILEANTETGRISLTMRWDNGDDDAAAGRLSRKNAKSSSKFVEGQVLDGTGFRVAS